MNLTDMRCALKFLGWENKYKTRESAWRDDKGNSILFTDDQIILRLYGKINRYPYIGTDLKELMGKIMETVDDDNKKSASFNNSAIDPFGLPK